MARTEPWAVSDGLWEQVVPLIPPTPSHAKGGRPRMPDRQAFAATVYVLRTGIQWNALPRELGRERAKRGGDGARALSGVGACRVLPAAVAGGGDGI